VPRDRFEKLAAWLPDTTWTLPASDTATARRRGHRARRIDARVVATVKTRDFEERGNALTLPAPLARQAGFRRWFAGAAWRSAGRECRPHLVGDRPKDRPAVPWRNGFTVPRAPSAVKACVIDRGGIVSASRRRVVQAVDQTEIAGAPSALMKASARCAPRPRATATAPGSPGHGRASSVEAPDEAE